MGFDTPSGGGGAPTDAAYLTGSSDPNLSNETVVSNPENAPDWTEDGNSPFTASQAATLDATLADSPDVILGYLETVGGGSVDPNMQVNNDANSNYRYITFDGSLTMADTAWDFAPGTTVGTGTGRFSFTMAVDASNGVTYQPLITTAGTSILSVGNNESQSTLDSIQVNSGDNSTDFTMELYGRSID